MCLAGSLTALNSGCATQAPNPWDQVSEPPPEAVRPVRLPQWPDPVSFDEETVTFDLPGAQALTAFKAVAEANTGIAEDNAAEIDELRGAVTDLTEAGRAQRTIADMRAEMLEDERRHNFYEKIGLWIIIVALGASL